MAQKFVKLIYNKTNRRIAAGALFGSLLLKNSAKHIWPENLFFPAYAYPSNDDSILQASKFINECRKDVGRHGDVPPIKPFVSRTTDIISAGFSAFAMKQSHIGIPKSFFCDTVEELSHLNLGLGQPNRFRFGKSVIFDKLDDDEIKLMKSMILSEDAKHFAVARHISFLKRNWALYQAFVPSFYVLVGYFMAFHSPKILFALSGKPVPLAHILGVTFLGCTAAYIMCKLTKAALCRRIGVQADMDAAIISKDYAKGGVEMYDKLLETNKALRILLGKKGERLYTADGDRNENRFFSCTGPKFTIRKQHLGEIVNPVSCSDASKVEELHI